MCVEKLNLYKGKCLSCVLMVDVENAPDVKRTVISGELECAIIKPSLILDVFQIGVAANKALLAESLGKLTTKTIYSETLFNLSISKNISQSLLKFGVDDKDCNMIVATFTDDIDVSKIVDKIKGKAVPFSELSQITNEGLVRKTYKITDSEVKASSLLDVVVSKIATKDFTGY